MNSRWQGVAAFAGGAVTAVVVSRFLPPLMAQTAGMASGAMGRDPFQSLVKDHQVFREMLTAMERSPQRAVFDRTQRLLRLKRRLTAHALAEEDVIYPLIGERAEAEDARRLYAEHAEIKMLLHALEKMPKDDANWTEKVRALKDLIERHGRQEEDVEFPRLRGMLDERAATMLSGSVGRERAMVL